MGHPLIDEFVEQQVRFDSSVKSGDTARALEDYQRLSGVYSRIASSDVEDVHKGIAFDQVSSAYKSLQSLHGSVSSSNSLQVGSGSSVGSVVSSNVSRLSSFSVRDVAVVCSFVVLVLGVLFVDPQTVGFSFLGSDNTVTFTKHLGVSFDKSSELVVPLSRAPSSLYLSGSLSGGSAKVFLLSGGSKLLIVDSSRDGLSFSRVCGSACSLTDTPKDFSLLVEVSGGSLSLDSLEFSAVVAR